MLIPEEFMGINKYSCGGGLWFWLSCMGRFAAEWFREHRKTVYL